MANKERIDGKCLCGAVQITATPQLKHLGACHCTTCRTWGGGPFFAVDCGTEIEIKGQKDIQVYNSSDWAERGFCKSCGTHLFYRLKESGQYIVSAGIYIEKTFEFDHQVFIDEKPEYYEFSNQTQNMTGPEVFAKYSGN